MRVHKPKRRQGRPERRFRPGPWSDGQGLETGLELETRVLLSARAAAMTAAHHARTHVPRVTPAAEINAQYAMFTADFLGTMGSMSIVNDYVTAINEQSTGTVTVSTTVTPQPYTPPSPLMQVKNASVFFPNGSTTPVIATATATKGGASIGTFYLTGFSGNSLIVNTTLSTPVSLPVNTVLTATLTPSSLASAASIIPSYIINRTNQMAIDLVEYFNSLPLRLPFFNTPPHTPNNRGAIQNYVYGAVAGGGSTSLQQSLLAIPLPTTAGSDLQIYKMTVASAIEQSLIQTLNGVSEIYAHQLRVAITSPNNRYGVIASTTIPAYILASH
jgi:hypothetical protein